MTDKVYFKDITERHYQQVSNNLLASVILHCTTRDIIERSKEDDGKKDNKYIEVDLRLNGVEVSFVSYLTYLDSIMDKMVTDKAKELIRNEVWDLTDTINDLRQGIKEAILDKVRDSGLAIDEYYLEEVSNGSIL